MSTTTLLFFFRVRAMYRDSKLTVLFFLFMWAVISGSSITPVFYRSINLGPTEYCTYLVPPEYERAADILPIINGLFVYIHDTLVFAAITLKLVGTPGWSAETGRGWIRLLFSGNYLPRFSRAMLRDGQAYYL